MPDPTTEPGELELRDYLTVLRRRKLIIIITTVLVVGLALAYSLLQTPVYQATSEVLLEDSVSNILNPEDQPTSFDLQRRIQTEIEVMRSQSVRDAVRDELGYVPAVTIAAKGDTDVVSISATDPDKERAAREADTYANTYIEVRRAGDVEDLEAASEALQERITEIDAQLDDLQTFLDSYQDRVDAAPDEETRAQLEAERDQAQRDADAVRLGYTTQRTNFSEQNGDIRIALSAARTGGGRVVSEARVPSTPISPVPVRNAAVALILGLLLGAGLAFLRDYLDDTVRTKEDVDAISGGLDVLGLVPRVESWKNRSAPQLVSVSAPNSPAAEAYRSLRTGLQFIGIDREMRLIQLTSAAASEGKTTTIANLGVIFARAGHRTIIVDCDLRRPRLHQFFGLDNSRGLTTALLGTDSLEDAVQAVPNVPRLGILPSGPPPPNPSELLATRTTASLLSALADHADFVLIDCPPLLPVADAAIVAGYVDATVLVAAMNSTTKRSLARSLELLDQIDAPLVGAVLNGMAAQAAYAYGYGDGGYAESYAGDAPTSLFSRRGRSRRIEPDEAASAPLPDEERDRSAR